MTFNPRAALLAISLTLVSLVPLLPFTATAEEAQEKASGEQVALVEKTTFEKSPESESSTSQDKIGRSNEFSVQTAGGAVNIAVKNASETGHASLYINNKETLRFRSKVGEYTPDERARLVAGQLHQYLLGGGNPRDIKPGMVNALPVIRAGEKVLVTVDAKTAKESKNTDKQLAMIWTNNLRQALGADAINRGQERMASRGMSGISPLGAAAALENYRPTGMVRTGMASWYGPGFHGRRSSDGSRFNMHGFTAAHRTLPFGTLVKVSNARTGKSCVVKITDRGPFIGNRIIDLSRGAASAVGMLGSGVAKVTMEVLSHK